MSQTDLPGVWVRFGELPEYRRNEVDKRLARIQRDLSQVLTDVDRWIDEERERKASARYLDEHGRPVYCSWCHLPATGSALGVVLGITVGRLPSCSPEHGTDYREAT